MYKNSIAHRFLNPEEDVNQHDYINLMSMVPIDNDLVHICEICLNECDPVLSSCHHTYCTSCWRRWLSSLPPSSEARCPYPNCSTVLDLVAQHWLAGPILYDQMRQGFLMDKLVKDPLLHQCSKCKRIAKRSNATVTSISCACGFNYCSKCNKGYHFPATCEELAKYTKYKQTIRSSRNMEAEVKVRRCPKCNIAWEKMWGCNHMICGQCSQQFCWGCGGDSSQHSNGYWCGTIKIPLEVKQLTFLPTEIAIMKQIELFSLSEGLKSISRKRKANLMHNLITTKSEWIGQVLDDYERYLHFLKYGSMCKRTLDSKKKTVALQRGIQSMQQMYELFNASKIDSYWNNLIKIYLIDIKIAYQYICKNNL